MVRIDVFPAQGTFRPGETVRLIVEIRSESAVMATLHLSISHLASTVERLTMPISLAPGDRTVMLTWQSPATAPRGYGADLELRDRQGEVLGTASTAFDVLDRWAQAPRYGFLTDFAPGRENASATMRALAKFHINALQFYDWMYRHDTLLPPADEYADLLERPLSLATIRALIAAAHRHGMAAMPYTVIYAASPEFARAHPGWALFQADGKPIEFAGGFLSYMNPADGSSWRAHLLGQFDAVLRALDFDGIHIDQYGDPIAARDAAGKILMLDQVFATFIDAAVDRARAIRSDSAIVFNCVGNWPIDPIARSRADFMYIELWKPYTAWRDLWQITVEARRLSGKPVVLAAYIDPAREHNVRLADAIVFASGGSRIALGEPGGMLADPYFPKYGQMGDSLAAVMRAYYDFAVRYENVLALDTRDVTDAWAGRITIDGVSTDLNRPCDAVWPIVRQGEGFACISLINLLGLASPMWAVVLPTGPTPLAPFTLCMCTDRRVRRVWWASPDESSACARPVVAQVDGDCLKLAVPGLSIWTLILLEWER
jgi:dextranase